MGTRVLVLVLKAVAVLVWLGSLTALLVPGVAILGDTLYLDLANVLGLLAGSSVITSALGGLIAGFVLFGLGEIIALLDDIRKNTR